MDTSSFRHISVDDNSFICVNTDIAITASRWSTDCRNTEVINTDRYPFVHVPDAVSLGIHHVLLHGIYAEHCFEIL